MLPDAATIATPPVSGSLHNFPAAWGSSLEVQRKRAAPLSKRKQELPRSPVEYAVRIGVCWCGRKALRL
jgi:hypothetical protein